MGLRVVTRDRSAHAWRPTSDRRSPRALPVVLLALSVIGWHATSEAGPDAPDAQTTYRLASTRAEKVCVGSDGQITVSVVRHTESGAFDAPKLLAGGFNDEISDVVIDTTLSDPSIIEMDESSRVTGLDGGWDPPTATFTFDAKRAGTTQLTFTARLAAAVTDFGWRGPARDVTLERTITVINCKFEVTVLSKFVVEGPANLSFGNAVLQLELTQSDDGELRQSATAEWFASVSGVGDCFGTLTANTSEVAVFGRLAQDGALSVDVKFEPFSVTLASNCGGFTNALTPSALHFEGPNRGFSGSLLSTLTSPLGGAPGISAYYVVPTDENVLPN